MLCVERKRNTEQVHAVSRCHEKTWRQGRRCTGQREEENRKTAILLDTGISPKRYRENISSLGQEDLDTSRGAVGQKTGKGGRPIQGRGQRGYSHRA